MMPNLLGATPQGDKDSMQECFENQLFRPDELKIYPMMVTDMAELTDIWKS
jgi:histone acetyltransferase (RNA polymerase elongator complex component)